MKSLQIIYHVLFALLGSFLLINQSLSKDLISILATVLIINGILVQIYSVLKRIYFKYLPTSILFLILYVLYCYLYFTRNFNQISEAQLLSFLTITATFLSYYFTIDSVFRFLTIVNFKAIKTGSFQKYYQFNNLSILVVFILFITIYSFTGKDFNKISNYSLIVLILSFPFLNVDYIRGFVITINQIVRKFELNITFDQFGKLAKIKNFVFAKDNFISSENYKIVDSDYRSTVKVLTIMQLCYQLSTLWNRKYTKLFVLDDYEKNQLKLNIVEQNENGITVIDNDAVMYHFGNHSFIKDKIKGDETSNLFLVKNGLLLAKFKISERFDDQKAELINSLDYFGNTIMFNPGMKEDLAKEYTIVFDKIYSGANEKRQIELLNELEKKAPTIYFSAKGFGSIINSLSFYISNKVDAKKDEKLIICNSDNVHKVPLLIVFSKKLHSFFKYSLLFSVIVQIALLLFALFNYQKSILIISIQLTTLLSAELISLYYKRKIIYLPGHPDNLAQSHQAA